MVLSYDEEKEIQMLKQKFKLELLNKQHSQTMLELEKQLQIEAIKAYQEQLDFKFKEKLMKIAFDKDGKENIKEIIQENCLDKKKHLGIIDGKNKLIKNLNSTVFSLVKEEKLYKKRAKDIIISIWPPDDNLQLLTKILKELKLCQ